MKNNEKLVEIKAIDQPRSFKEFFNVYHRLFKFYNSRLSSFIATKSKRDVIFFLLIPVFYALIHLILCFKSFSHYLSFTKSLPQILLGIEEWDESRESNMNPWFIMEKNWKFGDYFLPLKRIYLIRSIPLITIYGASLLDSENLYVFAFMVKFLMEKTLIINRKTLKEGEVSIEEEKRMIFSNVKNIKKKDIFFFELFYILFISFLASSLIFLYRLIFLFIIYQKGGIKFDYYQLFYLPKELFFVFTYSSLVFVFNCSSQPGNPFMHICDMFNGFLGAFIFGNTSFFNERNFEDFKKFIRLNVQYLQDYLISDSHKYLADTNHRYINFFEKIFDSITFNVLKWSVFFFKSFLFLFPIYYLFSKQLDKYKKTLEDY